MLAIRRNHNGTTPVLQDFFNQDILSKHNTRPEWPAAAGEELAPAKENRSFFRQKKQGALYYQ
jgi:hypothetical protein